MKRMPAVAVSVAVLTLGLTWAILSRPTVAEDPKPATDQPAQIEKPAMTLRDFMRRKLQASNQILEGLALEDMDMVKTGATTLNSMSSAERWRVRTDVMYAQFSGEFQRNTKELISAADDHNLDKAALKWMAATMNCIECHRFVRHNLVVQGNVQP